MKKSQATMRDVARVSGLSLSTVSEALRNKSGVSAETRARVLEVAEELGYQYSPQANSAAKTIGMLIPHHPQWPLIPVNPFYSHVLAGAELECQRQGANLMYASLEIDDCSRIVSWPARLFNTQVDGFIAVGTHFEEDFSHLPQIAERAVVLVDSYTARVEECDYVLIDNVNGAKSAVEYLIEQGHTAIGLIGSEVEAHPSGLERREGYQRALAEHGIKRAYIVDGPLRRVEAYKTTLALLRTSPEVTAIFACNDECALGVMKAAQELHRRIPEDLSLVGFDDIQLAQEVTPPLTTIHVDKLLLGALGVRFLMDQITAPERTKLAVMVRTQLVIRDSVKAVK
jgi:LacI family transcriptional regulator